MPAHEYLNGEQLSMFLPARNLIKLPPNPYELHNELGHAEEAGYAETPKQAAKRLWAMKLDDSQQEPEPGGANEYGGLTLPKKYDENLDLHDSIKKHGVVNPVPLSFTDEMDGGKDNPYFFGKSQYIIGGHHRIAAAEDINPNMEIPVVYHSTVEMEEKGE